MAKVSRQSAVGGDLSTTLSASGCDEAVVRVFLGSQLQEVVSIRHGDRFHLELLLCASRDHRLRLR